MDSYWELYLAYIRHCERQNEQNGIDPHHYEMEWNHTLPRCIFGDQPLGQWLTLRQHAIASALQTLAFGYNCLYSTHKKFLPNELLTLAWPLYCQRSKKVMSRTQASRTKEDKAEASRKANSNRTFEERSESNKKANLSRTPETRRRIAKIAGQASAARSPQERSESAKKGAKTKGLEVLQRVSKIANETWLSKSTPEQRSEIMKAARQRMTPEERSAAILKGWETRRAKKREKSG